MLTVTPAQLRAKWEREQVISYISFAAKEGLSPNYTCMWAADIQAATGLGLKMMFQLKRSVWQWIQLNSSPEQRDFNKLGISELVILHFMEYVSIEHLDCVNLIELIQLIEFI